jgi:Flp pilus assembly protein protease CpaA
VLQRILMFAPLIALLTWAAIVDLRQRRIPNWLTFSLMLGGLCLATAGISPAGSFSHSAAGLGLGFGLALILYLLGAWGAGDLKLFAGVGAWIGPLPLLFVFALAAIGGMIVALWVSARHGKLGKLLNDSALITVSAIHGSKLGAFSPQNRVTGPSPFKPAPYALHLLVATLLVLTGAILSGR